jgi:hypothetical protein
MNTRDSTRMDPLPREVVWLIVVRCDLSSVLVLARVSVAMNKIVESTWSYLYTTRYQRQPLLNVREEYKKLLSSSGRVVRYNRDGAQLTHIHDRRKYMQVLNDVADVNAHRECTYRGQLLEKEVIDVYDIEGWGICYLSILTDGYFVVYLIKGEKLQRKFVLELEGGKCLVDNHMAWYPNVEMYDGTVLTAQVQDRVWLKVAHTRCKIHYNGEVLEVTVHKHRVYTSTEYSAVTTDSEVYISSTRSGDTVLLRLSVYTILACQGALLLLTTSGELLRYDGELRWLADDVLLSSLVVMGDSAHFVQRELR